MNFESNIENVAVNLLRLAVIQLPQDVKKAIERAYRKESSYIGKIQLKTILDNISLAEEKSIPVCQDTGIISFYLEAGSRFRKLDRIEYILRRAVKRATEEIPLRPNSVNPFTQKVTNDNTGTCIPYFQWRIVSGDYLRITVFPKGGGSENTSALRMMNPSSGVRGLKKFIVETVTRAGGMPCPPTIIGVGIGGGSNIAMELAKRALLRPIDNLHQESRVRELENELREAVNKTGIGPMGLGGDTTTLAVKIMYADRHPASYPVAVAFQCWAARRASVCILYNGEVKYLTHKM